MRVHDLGPLTVTVDAAERSVSGTKVPAILAMLVININRRVSADALMEAAWGDALSAAAASTLLSHMWRVRQLLEPSRAHRAAPSVVLSDAGGYRLVGSAQSVDSLAFEQLADDARDLLAAGQGVEAVRRADEALSIWRGRPYGALADRQWAAPAVARLDEIHEQVLERRVEALLQAGDLDRALADLEPLIAAMPFRERLWNVRMLALYRSGRAEEALDAYQRARGTLIEQLGTEPGDELQDLQQKILANDPELSGPTRPESLPRRASIEVQIPAVLTPLIGRDEDRAALTTLVGDRGLTTITGPAGCGKTRLAIQVARDLATDFPDGVWFVDLGAVSDPELVADVVISTIGFAASPSATPLEEVRTYLRGRRMLLVLDNCEHVLPAATQLVQVTLGSGDDPGQCALLATSREPLAVVGETIWTLGPLQLPSDDADSDADPAAAPAVELFLQRLRTVAPALRVDEHDIGTVVEICAAVDGLPLALELAAARARSYTLDDILAQVSADPSQLSRIGRGPADHRATLRSAIEWSHQMLTGPERLVHRRLSVLPGPFTRDVAAAVVGPVLSSADVDDLLAQLVHRSMLTSNGAQRRGGPTVFTQLATVRGHAHHRLADAGEHPETVRRRDEWTQRIIWARPPLGSAADVQWLLAIDDGYTSVRATLANLLIDNPSELGGKLASRLGFYWYFRSQGVEAGRWLARAHDILKLSRSTDLLITRTVLASTLAVQGRFDLARPLVDDIVEQLDSVPAKRLTDVGRTLVALTTAMWVGDHFDLMIMLYQHLAQIAERAGDADLAVVSDAVGCAAAIADGRVEAGVNTAYEVYERAVTADNIQARWIAAASPMIAALLARDFANGVPWLTRLIRDHLQLGSGGAVGSFIEARGSFAVYAGEYFDAARYYAAARKHTRRAAMVWPRHPWTSRLEADVQERLSPNDFARAWREGQQLTATDIVDADSRTRW